jgi:hypothetical protein
MSLMTELPVSTVSSEKLEYDWPRIAYNRNIMTYANIRHAA